MYDVAVIGAGCTGSAIARYLSRYQVKACVIEREEDVCDGTSKANSAIVHAGFDAHTGTMKAKMNVRGSEMMEDLSRELDFPYDRNGSLVVATADQDASLLDELKAQGEANGVKDIRTLAENAADNGVEFFLNTTVEKISREGDHYLIETDGKPIKAKAVVNAAGVYADAINNMVSSHKYHITARRGQYNLLDKTAGSHVRHTIFQLPTKMGKGVLVTPTVHGNLLVGPTAEDIDNKEGVNTTADGLGSLPKTSALSVKNIPFREVITAFAGLRAHEDGGDFVIGEAEDAPNFFNALGIESPGLSSAPAIGEYLADMVAEKLGLLKNPNFNGTRKGILDPSKLSIEERNELIRKEPAYGQIICRCEMITEGQILDAIHRTLGARSLDGVKRRTRAGMGRCQAGFCSPRTMEILEREVPMSAFDVTKTGGQSKIVIGYNKRV